MFTLTIETDNAAFSDETPDWEVARILRAAANKVERGDARGKLYDSNGNQVGEYNLI